MRTIIKNFIYNSLYQVLLLAVPLITTPYLTRTIGADGVGIYSYNYSITTYFTMFIMLGLENYGNREIAKKRGDLTALSDTFCSIYYLQLIMGIFVIFAYSLFSSTRTENRIYTIIFVINIISSCLDVNWALYGLELFKTLAIRNTCIKALTTVLIFLLVKEESDVIVYCLVMLLCNLFSQMCTWPVILRYIKLKIPRLDEILSHLKPNLWLFLTVMSVGIYKSTDKIMLGYYDESKIQVGFYELAERIISIPNILTVSLGTVMMPRVTNMISQKDKKHIELIIPSMFFSMCLAASMCFGIMGIAKEFVPLFYGEGFESCISLYLILTPCSIFMSFANVIRTQYILPHSKDKILVRAGIYGTIFNICLNLFLIPRYGANGAAMATLLAEAFGCSYQTLSVRKELPIRKYVYITCPIVLIGIIMCLILYNMNLNVLENTILSIAIKVILGVVLFIGPLLLYVFFLKSRIKHKEK